MVTKTNKPASPLVDTLEETSGPITVVGDDLDFFGFRCVREAVR
jgi:hypothetical protein